jgi:tetratricopeptide (TPR) repeat protein
VSQQNHPDRPFLDPYVAARITGELIGRNRELERILAATGETDASQLLYISGAGGIGKTRLLIRALEVLSQNPQLHVAAQLVDLYHVETSTVEGLVSELVRVLDTDERFFPDYVAQRRAYDEVRLQRPSELVEIASLRTAMVEAFQRELHNLATAKPVVIALDTAEKLALQKNPLVDLLGVGESETDIVQQLCAQLNATPRVVVLLAGRPGDGTLAVELQRLLTTAGYRQVNLFGLNEEEALAYFDAVKRELQESTAESDRLALRRLQPLTPDFVRKLFFTLCDEGAPPTVRPILLALAIDHLVVAGEVLPEFRQDLATAQALTPAQRAENRQKLGAAVIQIVAERLAPADWLVRYLGWLRKGADQAMLARLSNLPAGEFAAAWTRLQQLSFVKLRLRDDRLFLHDELYEIVERHSRAHKEHEGDRDRFYTRLATLYEGDIERIRQQIDALNVPLATPTQGEVGNLAELVQLRGLLRALKVEYVFYRLRQHAGRGFRAYFRVAEEAVADHDEELGALLRAEMRALVEEVALDQKPEGVQGLQYAVVVADEAVRWIEWLHDGGQNDEAVDLARRLQGELFATLIEPAGPLTVAELKSWRGLLEAEIGDYATAERLLEEAIASLTPAGKDPRQVAMLARAYNNQGYTFSNMGRRHRAIEAYTQALPLWRALKMESQQANTLNNLAFELAQIGDFDKAHAFIRDALRLREKAGPDEPVGYSLNTMAEISVQAFASEVAAEQVERALALFRNLRYARGMGFSLRALAEAKRRVSISPTNVQTRQTVRLLAEAEAHAKEACAIFTQQVHEPVRRVWALIELGCVYRDWLRWRQAGAGVPFAVVEQPEIPVERSNEELFGAGVAAFHEAEEVSAAINQSTHRLDALINHAWLLYYYFFDADQVAFRAEGLEQVTRLFDTINALFQTIHGPQQESLTAWLHQAPRDDLLVRRGDWEVLQGELTLARYALTKERALLETAATHLLLSYACYQRYSDRMIRQARRARTRIYNIVKAFEPDEMVQLYELVEAVEQQNGLTESEFSRFLAEQFGPKESHVALDL